MQRIQVVVYCLGKHSDSAMTYYNSQAKHSLSPYVLWQSGGDIHELQIQQNLSIIVKNKLLCIIFAPPVRYYIKDIFVNNGTWNIIYGDDPNYNKRKIQLTLIQQWQQQIACSGANILDEKK